MLGVHGHAVTAGLAQRFDVIVTKPPFHAQGNAARPDIGRRFIAVAAEALKPGGRLWLVANRHLPYESVLDASFSSARLVAQRDGFKVVEAVKATHSPGRAPRSSCLGCLSTSAPAAAAPPPPSCRRAP